MNRQITRIKFLVLAFITLLSFAATGKAQTTAFTYQGRLNDATVASPTNGTYQMQFKLYDAAQIGAGTQVENTVTIPTVQVVNGIFTVPLDFGNRAFNNSNRFIEISVQPTGGSGYTTLSPRQQVTNVPLAIRSLSADFAASASNAVQLGGLAASNYTQNNDARLSNDRNPLAGSENYIQNQNTTPQSGGFNVAGSGTVNGFFTAGSVNTGTNYKIGTQIVFGTPNTTSVVVGQSANFNVTGEGNSFFGSSAGKFNLTARYNSFFGNESGSANTIGERNSFFGFQSGQSSKIVDDNSFFGYQAGKTTTGGGNSFFGSSAGISNTTGSENTFIGNGAGSNNSNGSNNTIVGSSSFLAGSNNTAVGNDTTTIGSNNTVIGFQSVINGGAVHSTVIGTGAATNKSNTIVLGTNADTVEAPNLLTAKNITVSTKVDASTVDAGLGIFDLIKLNNTPFGDKPLCLKTTTKEIGVCPSSFSNPADSQTDSFAKLVNQQSEKIEAQQKQLQQQQILIESLRKLVCASNVTADVCKEVK